jgi:hypothetical protein
MNSRATLSNDRTVKDDDNGTVCIHIFGLLCISFFFHFLVMSSVLLSHCSYPFFLLHFWSFYGIFLVCFIFRFQQHLFFLQYSMHLTIKSSVTLYRLIWVENQDEGIYLFARNECSCFAVWENFFFCNVFYYFFSFNVSLAQCSLFVSCHSVYWSIFINWSEVRISTWVKGREGWGNQERKLNICRNMLSDIRFEILSSKCEYYCLFGCDCISIECYQHCG